MKEFLEVFDENNKTTGTKEERSKVHELGLWHREVQIWVVNEKNEVLIQKRSATKKLGANKWSLTGGHVPVGESIVEGALRESEEELGLENLKPSSVNLVEIEKVDSNKEGKVINNCYKYCYILKTNKKIEDFKLQKEEVSEVKYVTFDKLKNLSNKEKEEFTGLFKKADFIDKIEKVENKLKDIEEE